MDCLAADAVAVLVHVVASIALTCVVVSGISDGSHQVSSALELWVHVVQVRVLLAVSDTLAVAWSSVCQDWRVVVGRVRQLIDWHTQGVNQVLNVLGVVVIEVRELTNIVV